MTEQENERRKGEQRSWYYSQLHVLDMNRKI